MMLLLIHILSALGGIGLTTYSYMAPSVMKIRYSYGLVLVTIVSGTIIIVKNHLSILSICLSGLLYVGFTVSGLVAASRRLAGQENQIR
jgi:hypothetical protein